MQRELVTFSKTNIALIVRTLLKVGNMASNICQTSSAEPRTSTVKESVDEDFASNVEWTHHEKSILSYCLLKIQ